MMEKRKVEARELRKILKMQEVINQPDVKEKMLSVFENLLSERSVKEFNLKEFFGLAINNRDEESKIRLVRIQNKYLLERMLQSYPFTESEKDILRRRYDGSQYLVPFISEVYEKGNGQYLLRIKQARATQASFDKDIKFSAKNFNRTFAEDNLENQTVALINGLIDSRCRIGSDVCILYTKKLAECFHAI